MKRIIQIIITFVFLVVSLPTAAQQSALANRPVLCQPGVYLIDPQNCLPSGPSAYRTRLAEQGIVLPLVQLPAHQVDINLGYLPYLYATLKEGNVPVFGTLDDAIANANPIRYIEDGDLRYVSYVTYERTPQGNFIELRSGGWAAIASRQQGLSLPHGYLGGLEFTRTPFNSFGWILPGVASVESKHTPGSGTSDYTGHLIYQYSVVQVYATQQVNGSEWYLIGPDEWIEGRMIGRVIPNTTPPPGVLNGRWVEVNLYEQTLSVYENSQLIYATLIASGMDPFFTKPGLFNIYKKQETTPMQGTFEADRSDFYYLEDVPYTMYYDHARALHGAYWRTFFGYPQSHGCVNLSIADARWLFEWSVEGDWIYVWDPSGATPADPAYYGEGGA